ncbi:hypothetical protein GCM10027035_32680 [Emticicia sediminis]
MFSFGYFNVSYFNYFQQKTINKMEKFNSYEINANDVIGGTAISTPCICVPSVTVNPAPVVGTVKTVLGGTVAKVGGLLGGIKHTLASTSAHVSASVHVGVSAGTGYGC